MSVTMNPAISGQKLQQEALNNLDFEDYKKQVYKEREKEKKSLQKNPPKYKFNDNYCDNKSDINNAYLFTGIFLIAFAIVMMMVG